MLINFSHVGVMIFYSLLFGILVGVLLCLLFKGVWDRKICILRIRWAQFVENTKDWWQDFKDYWPRF